jgi:hypothetical protein
VMAPALPKLTPEERATLVRCLATAALKRALQEHDRNQAGSTTDRATGRPEAA